MFLLPQRKIRCATTSFFGVGGSGRRPLESTAPPRPGSAELLLDWGALRAPQGGPGVLNFTAIYYTLATLAYRGRSWAALEVGVASQDVSGELPEALWRRFGSSWGALGALFGGTF